MPSGPLAILPLPGNRSSIVWAMGMAGQQPTDSLIQAAARFGYDLGPFRTRIEALAQG